MRAISSEGSKSWKVQFVILGAFKLVHAFFLVLDIRIFYFRCGSLQEALNQSAFMLKERTSKTVTCSVDLSMMRNAVHAKQHANSMLAIWLMDYVIPTANNARSIGYRQSGVTEFTS